VFASKPVSLFVLGLLAFGLAACGGAPNRSPDSEPADSRLAENNPELRDPDTLIWNLFDRSGGETSVQVNRYLWNASLEVLGFLPVDSVDPFTGVIVMGYGTPPGGGRAYRATVLIDDPALDARSLNLSLQTRSGPASASTVRAVEDAILTRARQLRTDDSRF